MNTETKKNPGLTDSETQIPIHIPVSYIARVFKLSTLNGTSLINELLSALHAGVSQREKFGES